MARKMLIDGEVNHSNEEETHYDFDLFVIGAGSGGVRAGRFAANFGAKVLLWKMNQGLVNNNILWFWVSHVFMKFRLIYASVLSQKLCLFLSLSDDLKEYVISCFLVLCPTKNCL